jgi:hypothetical protein
LSFSAAKRSLFTFIDRDWYFLKRPFGGQKVRYRGLKRLSLKRKFQEINKFAWPDPNPFAIKVKLDPDYYGIIDDLDQRFAAGAPSLVACDELTVEGDVRFEKDVTIKGTVCINNRHDAEAVIKAGTVIDKDLVF